MAAVFSLIRFDNWWHTIAPQVLGWLYFSMLYSGIQNGSIGYLAQMVALFVVALVFVSAFGFLLNDFCDVESDKACGKPNLISYQSATTGFFIVVSFLAVGIVAWCFMGNSRPIATVLFALQIVLLVVYSARPFRLKVRGFAGEVTDALYAHVNPIAITLSVFAFYNEYFFSLWEISFLILLFLVLFLKGIRNILLHQMRDRKADKIAGIKTFAVSKGGLFVLHFVNRSLVVEIAATCCLVIYLSYRYPPLLMGYLCFIFVYYLLFSGWKLAYLPKRQLLFKFHFFLNDYFEDWMPISFLIVLIVKYPYCWPLLLIHLVVFPKIIVGGVKNLKNIRQNFKMEENY